MLTIDIETVQALLSLLNSVSQGNSPMNSRFKKS